VLPAFFFLQATGGDVAAGNSPFLYAKLSAPGWKVFSILSGHFWQLGVHPLFLHPSPKGRGKGEVGERLKPVVC
jgi:hypothetical protein